MSITARGGYQILDFKGEIAPSQHTPFVYDPELFEICKTQIGKKILIAYNGYMIEGDVKTDLIPCEVSEISFTQGSEEIPDGYTVYLTGLGGGTEVIIYNKKQEK